MSATSILACLPLEQRQAWMAERSQRDKLALLPKEERQAFLVELAGSDPAALADMDAGAWWFERRPKQCQPPGDWLVWVIGAGRGWGKNRTGAETLIDWVEACPKDVAGNRTEWMVVAQTLQDVKDLNIEGPSGLINVLRRRGYRKTAHPPKEGNRRKLFTYVKAPKPTIVLYPGGQVIHCDSADNEDVGRGYNLSGLWLDEVAKWGPMAHGAWYDGLLPALRADLPDGAHPRCIVTTTPKPIGLLKEWYTRARAGDTSYRLTIGSTYENASNLNRHSLAEFVKNYEGTRRGRQELYGELLDEVEGAFWTRETIEKYRRCAGVCRNPKEHPNPCVPPFVRLVLGVDPAGTGSGDEMGLVVVGQDANDEQYILADLSRKLAGLASARHAWKTLIEYKDRLPGKQRTPFLVVEEDYGKKWLKDVLDVVYKTMQAEGKFSKNDRPPVKFVSASLLGGKALRAEPVAMRSETGKVHIVGVLHGLEDQMCTWDPMDKKAHSPDRIDAMVHACAWLKEQEKRRVEVGSQLDGTQMPVTRLNV